MESQFHHIRNGAHGGDYGDNHRPPPTLAQKLAGNYKMGRIKLHGLAIAIEQPRGSVRDGMDSNGKHWQTRLAAHYGYVTGTKGADGDGVDVFVGTFPVSDTVYVINQYVDGDFDEHKVMIAFADADGARDAYRLSYSHGWRGLHSMVPMTIDQFKWWLRHGDMNQPVSLKSLPREGLDAMTKPVYWDADANPYDTTVDAVLYSVREHDKHDGLVFDALTAAEIVADAESTLTVDAMVTPYRLLERKAQVLQKVMERAGGAVKPVAMQITAPFTQRGVVNVAVVYELSDGQSVSIFFHNPDTTPKKLLPQDELVSWKWLLNKKDITIVVAPERGNDLNVREVARRLMKLAEKNSAAFARANKGRADNLAAIQSLTDEITVLEKDLAVAEHDLEVAKVAAENAPAFDPTSASGYAKVMASESMQLDYQDRLDSFFEERIMAIRNELRGSGWQIATGGSVGTKDGSIVDYRVRQVGAGKNLVGVTWFVVTGSPATTTDFDDDLTKTATEFAAALDGAAVAVIPPISLTGKELGEFDPTEAGKKQLREALREHLSAMLGEAVDCPVLGAKVLITKRGVRETIQHTGNPLKMKALFAIKELIGTAKSSEKQPNFKKEKKLNVLAYYRLKNQLVVGDTDVHVDLIVEEESDGIFHYDMMIEKTNAAMDCSGAASVSPSPPASKAGNWDDDIGAQDAATVNALDSASGGMVLNLFLKIKDKDGNWVDVPDDPVEADGDDYAIAAYVKAFQTEADRINAAVSAIDWDGIKDSASAKAETAKLAASAARLDLKSAQAGLDEAGINTWDDRLKDLMEAPEWKAYSDATADYKAALTRIDGIAKDRLKVEGANALTLLPADAPVEDMAFAVYQKQGIDISVGSSMVARIAAGISSKDAEVMREMLRNLDNKASEEIFTRATGVTLGKTQKERRAQIDAWAGVTPEQRASAEAGKDAAHQTSMLERALRFAWDGLKSLNIRNGDGAVSDGQAYVVWKFGQGYAAIKSAKSGASTQYKLANEEKFTTTGVKSKNFNAFLKAALAFGGLWKSLEFLGALAAITPAVAETAGAPPVSKIEAVDAAYKFENATSEFKEWLHDSIDQPDYSPFATAKAMDEAAKRNGAAVEWGFFGVKSALDDANSLSLQAAPVIVDGQEDGDGFDETEIGATVDAEDGDADDFDEDAEWAAYPDSEDALDAVALDGDFPGHPFRGNQYRKAHRESGTAVGASIRAKKAEKSGNAKAAKTAHYSAHLSHKAAAVHASGGTRNYHKKMARFHGKRSGAVMDAAFDDAYPGSDKKEIEATRNLLGYFRAFIKSDAKLAKVPKFVEGLVGSDTMTKEQAKSTLTKMIDIAINRKAGIEDLTPEQEKRLSDFRWDARAIDDYFNKRIRHTGSRNLLRTPEMKNKYPEIDNQPRDFDSALDDAGQANDGKDYVGKIVKDGAVAGRINIGGDGKAMVFVGAEGGQRVKSKSGNTFYYSDDDAAEMVECLFAVDQTAKPDPYAGHVMGVPVEIASTESVDGAKFELFKGNGDEQRAIVRVTDEDTGNVTSLKLYPNFAAAEKDFNDSVDIARKTMGKADDQLLKDLGVDLPKPAETPESLYAKAGAVLGTPKEQAGIEQGRAALARLRPFLPKAQYSVVAKAMTGEEGQFFIDKMIELAALIDAMPITYEQDGKGDDAIVSLHYFTGNADWYVTEKDKDGNGTTQAFGLADLGDGGELGYISIAEIVAAGAELDFHFKPRSLKNVMAKKDMEHKKDVQAAHAGDTEDPVTTADRALLQSVIDGTAVNMLEPSLADDLGAVAERHDGDPEMSALFEKAVDAYEQAMMRATA